MLLSRTLPHVPGIRRISTTSRVQLREAFRELKDLGFAPRFRDQHSRMIAKRPDPHVFYQFDEYMPYVALLGMFWKLWKDFQQDRRYDMDRILELQFRDVDDARNAVYEQHYYKMLEPV